MADGEDPGIDPRLVAVHLARCTECRALRDQIDSVPRPRRISASPAMPDLSGRVVRLNAIADRASRLGLIRGLLTVLALEIIVLSVPALVLGHEQDTSAHAARHLGAFSVAYAAALLVAVLRPARARSILPVASVLAGALAITATIDLIEGRIPLFGEAIHIPEILSVGLLWMLAVPGPRRRRRRRSQPVTDAPRDLQLIDKPDAAADGSRGI